MELEQPSGDSAVAETTTTESMSGGAEDIKFDEATGLPLSEQQPVEDDVEEDIDGVKLRGKKEALERIKAERLMQADYTRKTQDVAEQRKSIEAREQAFQQAAQNHQAYIKEISQVVAIDERLNQFSQVNWQQLTDQDPVQALKLHTEFTQLQAYKGQLVNTLTQKQQQAQQQEQRETARHLMEAASVLKRDIPNWSPELGGKLSDYGKTLGFDEAAMSNITNPSIVKLLHKAFMYDQLEKQRVSKTPAAPAPPATRLSGASAVSTKEIAQMSDAEFSAMRKRQIAQRR